MKHINDILSESLLDDSIKKGPNFKGAIKKFLKDNYKGASTCKIRKDLNPDGKYIVDSTSSIEVKNHNIDSLTNGLFVFGKIKYNFWCDRCNSLISLEGAPKEVGGIFNCAYCNSLISLEGAPKEVGGDFGCHDCNSLTSLKGAPKEVGGNFNCTYCNSLISLEGAPAPEKIGGNFNYYGCSSLILLKGIPRN